MIILGIDPGTATMGYGLLEMKPKRRGTPSLSYIYHDCIITSKDLRAEERLHIIEKELRKIIRTYKPDIMAIESLFFFKNLSTAMPVSEAKGIVLLMAAKYKLPVQEFSPPQIKLAVTGYGRSEKKQVQAKVQEILGLAELPKQDDAADALSVAITCSALWRG